MARRIEGAPDIAVSTDGAKQELLERMRGSDIFSVQQRRSIMKTLATYQAAAGASEGAYVLGSMGAGNVIPQGMRFNKQKMTDQMRDQLSALEKGTPPEISAKDRDLLKKRRDELIEHLTKEDVLETRKELHVLNRRDSEFYRAMDKAKRRPLYEADIKEYRNICRTLDPDDEDADSLDRLRRDK